MRVVGADACTNGWIFVELLDGAFERATFWRLFGDGLVSHPDAEAVAVDIPIGLPASGRRLADLAAREMLRPRSSSVFPTPPRPVLLMETYASANALSQASEGIGLPSQAYALRTKIFEVELLAQGDPRVFEVHPEVSFRAMAEQVAMPSKHTWAGLLERRAALARVGIVVPDSLGEAGVRAREWCLRLFHRGTQAGVVGSEVCLAAGAAPFASRFRKRALKRAVFQVASADGPPVWAV